MIVRGQNFKEVVLNIAGSSVFGRYPKISIEKSVNFFLSDNFIVPYPGFAVGIPQSAFNFLGNSRGIHTSIKFGGLIVVKGSYVYKMTIFFDQSTDMTFDYTIQVLNPNLPLTANTGVVYIAENNKPQLVISDPNSGQIYYYDPLLTPSFNIAYQDTMSPNPTAINFTPGFIDFHDTYILAAASNYTGTQAPANNTWRLGIIDPSSGHLIFPDNSASVGLIQTKPDNTQAVLRFPSRGNMIYVMGSIVSEPWFDVGAQLFPYQRQNQMNIDYGCLNPDTIARMDDLVVWLAQNETTGPIIVYSEGGTINKITTDGIDYLLSQLSDPSDSGAWMIRQDGHLIYHINFYTDNFSLFYDFNTKKFFNACDENLNVFLIDKVAFYNNQYYGISYNDGNIYAFDTIFTTFNGAEIPRMRTCANARLPKQEYFVANDVGFTIESGETEAQQEDGGAELLLAQDEMTVLTAQDGVTDLAAQTDMVLYINPRVDLSISTDGGATFGSDMPYVLNALGHRKNKLQWWQLGVVNDLVCQFKFWGLGRFVATDGILNIRQ